MTQTDRRPAGLDQRTADLRLYSHELLDETDGYIRVALADAGDWTELRGIHEGEDRIPSDARADMLDALAQSLVLESDQGIDVFMCPYAHRSGQARGRGRVAGGATTRRHAHADIDGPVDLERARNLGAWAVASGSTAADGTPQGHVYVRLTESVPPHVHTALCRALGQETFAEERAQGDEHHDTSKVNDNDVLRPPGTLNHKGDGDPRPVAWLIRPDDLMVRTWEPEALAHELGVRWPVPEPAEAALTTGEGREGLEPAPLAVGLAARRVDGLVRMVAEAERGAGNNALNHAAGVCAALCATAGEAEDLDAPEVRERLVRAYRDRLSDEPPVRREQIARATVASGWSWGERNVARALEDRRGDAPMTHEEHPTMADPGTTEEEEERSAAAEETVAERRQRLARDIARNRDTEYARLIGRAEGRALWEADLTALVQADPGRVLDEARARFELVDRDAVVEMPDPVDVVTGILPPPGEIGELSGSRGLGKSLLSLDLAGYVGSTSEHAAMFAGARPVNIHGPVLYVAREGWQGFTKRVRAWERYGWPVPGSVESLRAPRQLERVTFMPSRVDLREVQDAHGLGMVARALGAVLVVLDSAQGTGMGAEDTADTARYNAGVRIVRDTSEAAVLVLHNSGWDDSRGRGSTLLPDIAGTVMHFSGDPKGLRVLRDQKYRDGSAGEALGFTFHPVVVGQDDAGADVVSGVLTPGDLPSAMVGQAAEEQTRVLRALRDGPGASVQGVAIALGVGKDHARRTLAGLAADGVGVVENRGGKNRNQWHLTAKGEESLRDLERDA